MSSLKLKSYVLVDLVDEEVATGDVVRQVDLLFLWGLKKKEMYRAAGRAAPRAGRSRGRRDRSGRRS